jgi:hypothetical protein
MNRRVEHRRRIHKEKYVMKTNLIVGRWFLSSFVLAAPLLMPEPASAQHWTRVSGHTCVVNVKNAPGGAYKTFGGYLLVCPFNDSDTFRKQDVNQLNLHGSNTGDSIRVWACSRSWNAYNEARCTQAKPAGHGEFWVSFSRQDLNAAWGPAFAADFAYLLVETNDVDFKAAIYGIFASQ